MLQRQQRIEVVLGVIVMSAYVRFLYRSQLG